MEGIPYHINKIKTAGLRVMPSSSKKEKKMADSTQHKKGSNAAGGPKYHINIDGKDYDWSSNSITLAQIRQLAGWSGDQAINEINLKTGETVPISDSDTVYLKPGRGFAKKVEFVSGTVTPPRSHAC